MGDILILGAVAIWLGLWAARDLDRCGVTRRHASAAARRRRPRRGPLLGAGPGRPYVDTAGG
ncbi:hypothetical protein [Nocardioides pinisoli]|uniref:Uncharacterized protein n=1 Tax=Nocardioides pinisoli TaxID=2950279 RepID=A0ABT1KRJ0_9ACTN|nr:hypothetical protein [Nocardioides pinisoli]MCP3420282.1 hypothetical protein [Nocardioides pinisoli]